MEARLRFGLVAAAIIVGAATALGPAPARAGSFELWEGQADWSANAYAGQAAKAYDAGTAWANPAGMVRLQGNEIDGNFNYIDPQFYFTGRNTDFPDPGPSGPEHTHVSAIFGAALPASFSVLSLSPDLKFGPALQAPFGARIDYPENWVGRYQALVASLTDIALEPSLAYAVTPSFSIGGGPVIDYMSLRETQAVRPLLGYQYGDVIADVHGTDWDVGYNIGALYQFDDATRLGISYRSRIQHRLDITETLRPTLGLAESPFGPLLRLVLASENTQGYRYAKGSEKFNLPDNLDVSFFRQLTPEWSLMAELIWTNWSLFRTITISTQNANRPVSLPFGFRDTIFGSLGASYRPAWMPKLMLQAGVGYDQDPTTDATRQAEIPTDDRVLLGVGLTYDVNRMLSFELAYNHYFGLAASIDSFGPSAANALQLSNGRLTGSYDDSIDSFSGGMKLRF